MRREWKQKWAIGLLLVVLLSGFSHRLRHLPLVRVEILQMSQMTIMKKLIC